VPWRNTIVRSLQGPYPTLTVVALRSWLPPIRRDLPVHRAAFGQLCGRQARRRLMRALLMFLAGKECSSATGCTRPPLSGAGKQTMWLDSWIGPLWSPWRMARRTGVVMGINGYLVMGNNGNPQPSAAKGSFVASRTTDCPRANGFPHSCHFHMLCE
jgi:hypothetical protein